MRKKNRGSALAMSLVLLLFVTYFSVMIMDLSYSNLKLTRSYNEDRRMNRGTDYVVNLIAKRLQGAVKEIQDAAKNDTEATLEKSSKLRELHNSNRYLTENGAMSYEDYNHEFDKLYVENYFTKLRSSKYVGDTNGVLGRETLDDLSKNGSTKKDEYYILSLVRGERMYYKVVSGTYKEEDNTIEFVIDTKYEYTNEVRDGSTQQETTTVVKFKLYDGSENFNLLNYRIVNKKNDVLPAFTNRIALLSEKNVVFVGNSKKINVVGDVVAVGYIPVEGSMEKATATWKDYGGVIFGYSHKLASENIFGSTWTDQMKYGSSTVVDAGDVAIDGDVTTLGYVNVARNLGQGINICGDTYARQFVLSEDSHQADVWLGYGYNERDENEVIRLYTLDPADPKQKSKNDLLGKGNLYVTDDLQVDSSFAKLVVEGNFYGLSNTYGQVGGDSGGSDMSNEKRLSTLNINGDSVVELRNKVYIGGTSILTKLRDSDGVAYVTGISGTKTSQISAEAYIHSDKNSKVYKSSNESATAETKGYKNSEDGNSVVTMINGYSGKEGNYFGLEERAQHFKEYFRAKVQENFGLMGTMNFGNLRIKVDDNNMIQGWAEGVVIASGVRNFDDILGTEEVNAFFGSEFSENENTVFTTGENNPFSQYSIIQKYQANMSTFLETAQFGYEGRKIVQTGVDKHLTDYLNKSNSVLNDIKKKVTNGVYLHKNELLKACVYYSKNAKTIMSKDGTSIKIVSGGKTESLSDGYQKGIIFVEGDIFIKDGVAFEGVVIATGNITLEGKVDITRKTDVAGGDVVQNLVEQDYYVKTFFGLNEYDIDDNNAEIERINQDYVKVVKWEVGYKQ